MLVGLDTIEWSKLEDAYGKASDIPEILKQLETCADDQHSDLMVEFWNLVNHQGTIYEATPYIIPFLLQLIDLSPDPDRKAAYLYILAELAEDTVIDPYFYRTPTHVSRYQFLMQINDALEAGLDRFLNLLSHEHQDLKLMSLFILSYMAGQKDRIAPALEACFESAQEVYVQIAAVWAYARILDRHGMHVSSIQVWAQSSADFLTQAAATLSYLKLLQGFGGTWPSPLRLSDEIANLVVKLFETDVYPLLNQAWRDFDPETKYFAHVLSSLTPFDEQEEILGNSIPLWSIVLTRCTLTPKKAFDYVKRLLDGAFETFSFQEDKHPSQPIVLYKRLMKSESGSRFSGEYHQSSRSIRGVVPHKPGEPFTALQHQALEAVLTCDAFWQVETNLLSFFYGLPDDREALHTLLAAQS